MAKGLVYILTNPCLDGWVKIGMTERDDINQRLRELNAPTSIPFSYRCYATYAVDDPRSAERCIHSIIDNINSSLRARETLENGRVREREFFQNDRGAGLRCFQSHRHTQRRPRKSDKL